MTKIVCDNFPPLAASPGDEPAFPNATIDGYVRDGLTKWEWFAGQALAGLSTKLGDVCVFQDAVDIAKYAAEMADAMLAEGSKRHE